VRTEILVNGSFEKGLEGWTVDAIRRSTADIDRQIHHGKPTMRVDNPEPDYVGT